jgi:hypothetical protein
VLIWIAVGTKSDSPLETWSDCASAFLRQLISHADLRELVALLIKQYDNAITRL